MPSMTTGALRSGRSLRGAGAAAGAAPAVQVSKPAAPAGNGTKVTVRAWTKSGTYWDVYLGLLEELQKVFEENKIVVPFPQLDVHIKNN